ncbi:MAG: hypothetical protein PHP01_03495, partial [Phycisphaerae bacterium]|nr:hypothetical protein [Phycisphaerae bacterium]
MAKRLNKKVAIIGSLVLAILIMAAIFLILRMNRDPEKFIADAQVALALEEPDYKAAESAYGQAFRYSKGVDKKIDVLFKLADMYRQMNEWPKVAGCWNNIINYDTQNLKARLALLDYSYQIASSGSWTMWKQVESNVSELIGKELDTSPRMYRIKGQALLELVARGQVTDKEAGINDAIENLQKASQEEPNNVDTYQYLADAIIQKGQIFVAKGVLNAADNAKQEAFKVLLKGVENLPDESKAYINLYNSRLAGIEQNSAEFKKLESDLIDLIEKFKDSPLPYFAITKLYSKDVKSVDKAIASAEKARELDNQNVSYALTLADLRYRKYVLLNNEDDFQKAIDIATEALGFPDSLDIPGPRARISFINRYSLHNFLANCFVEKALGLSEGNLDKAKWLQRAEQEVYEINQLLGSAENPYAIMWRGRLLLAEGKINEAVVHLNTAYDALTAAAQTQVDMQIGRLSYDLARIFQNSSEVGAAVKYYSTAFKNGIYYLKPESVLNFAAVLLRVQDWNNSIDLINVYDKNFSENDRSRIIRITAYISANMFDEAKELLDKMPQDDPNTAKLKYTYIKGRMNRVGSIIANSTDTEQSVQDANTVKLRAEYDTLKNQLSKAADQVVSFGVEKLAESDVIDLCRQYVSLTENEKALKLADTYLRDNPNSVNVKVSQLMLNEPVPADVPPDRMNELKIKAMESIHSPLLKALLFGEFYYVNAQSDKAAEYYNQAIKLSPG